MNRHRFIMLPALALLSGCGSISGIVRDAGTGEPIAGARVELLYSKDPSGFISGPKTKRATSDASGAFSIDEESGSMLTVSTPDGRVVETSLCSASPFTVYVGGPNAGLRTNQTLVLQSSGQPDPDGLPEAGRILASDLGLSVSLRNASTLSITARGGLAFVPGTGAIPAPPSSGYEKSLTIDLNAECGWIFVDHDGRVRAAIEARPAGILSLPSGYEETTLMYADLAK